MSLSKSGGGESVPLYRDGTPITITLSQDESATVPSGKRWVGKIRADTEGESTLSINDNTILDADAFGKFGSLDGEDLVLKSGDTLDQDAGNSLGVRALFHGMEVDE